MNAIVSAVPIIDDVVRAKPVVFKPVKKAKAEYLRQVPKVYVCGICKQQVFTPCDLCK